MPQYYYCICEGITTEGFPLVNPCFSVPSHALLSMVSAQALHSNTQAGPNHLFLSKNALLGF